MAARPRLEEMLARLRERLRGIFGEGKLLRTQGQVVGGLIGGGRVIDNVMKTVDSIIEMAKQRRPNIIPTIMERIAKIEPGKRIREVVAVRPAPSPAAQPTPPEKRLLRG